MATAPGREAWLAQCLKSVSRPVVVVSGPDWEMAKLRHAYSAIRGERFFFLPDSYVVNDERIFDVVEDLTGSVAVTDLPSAFGTFAGVYERRVLKRVGFPAVSSKEEAVHYELEWARDYLVAAKGAVVLFPGFGHSEDFVERFGRINMVDENQFLTKYKGTWSREQMSGNFPAPPTRSPSFRRRLDRARARIVFWDGLTDSSAGLA